MTTHEIAEPAGRAHAARIWARRAGAELEAGARFANLASKLREGGAELQIALMAEAAASDEQRHARLCEELTLHLGGRPRARGTPSPREVAPSGLGARARVLYEVVAMSCITETLSAALLGTMVEAAGDPVVRGAVHEVLRDEVTHSRLGWAHLAIEAKRGACGVVSGYLPAMLEGTVTQELFVDDEEPDVSAPSLGALSRRERRDVFERCMADVVFPGLERFGVDAGPGRKWLAERSAPGGT